MRYIFPILFFLFLYRGNGFAQNYNDFQVVLHEEAINKVFTAVGEIKGTNEYEVMLIKGHYTWTIINPRINLKPDSSDFTCDAKVDVGPFNYKTQVVGVVKIGYDSKKNEISIRITRAIFELYTIIFGKKIHIKDIHLEDHFKDPFVFEGPKTLATDMTFTMPDSTIKTIYVQPTDCVMKVIKQAIVTSCEVQAADKPFNKPIKVQPPIQSVSDAPKTSTLTPATNGQKK
ncbi:MAG: hypothetical protein JST26_01465 [Bacteroidetes bacterium]|nr:hypothetical protein [Bacteroidota bacterium]